LSFDIEIDRLIPDDANWNEHIPDLGITCYGYAWRAGDTVMKQAGHGVLADGTPAPRMSRDECRALVDDLAAKIGRGFTLLTHNGMHFDLQVLAANAGLVRPCHTMALDSVDTLFHFLCLQGFPVGLAKVAAGMELPGKTEGMSGDLAPDMWAAGDYAKVLEYVAQDCVATLAVAEAVLRQGRLTWITQRGRPRTIPLKRWLTVRDALLLPLPDTSWMVKAASGPSWDRGDFVRWSVQPDADEGDSEDGVDREVAFMAPLRST